MDQFKKMDSNYENKNPQKTTITQLLMTLNTVELWTPFWINSENQAHNQKSETILD